MAGNSVNNDAYFWSCIYKMWNVLLRKNQSYYFWNYIFYNWNSHGISLFSTNFLLKMSGCDAENEIIYIETGKHQGDIGDGWTRE